MRSLALVFAAIAACAPAATVGAELAGVAMPDEVVVDGLTLHLNGLGLREATFLKVDVYVAGLYLEQPSSDAETILASTGAKRLVMEFVRKVKRADIVAAWNEGFAKNSGDRLPAVQPGLDRLNAWMPDFRKGDVLTLSYLEDRGVEVAINDEALGWIEGPEFARGLWAIWLGPEPPNPGLKQGLLGGS